MDRGNGKVEEGSGQISVGGEEESGWVTNGEQEEGEGVQGETWTHFST